MKAAIVRRLGALGMREPVCAVSLDRSPLSPLCLSERPLWWPDLRGEFQSGPREKGGRAESCTSGQKHQQPAGMVLLIKTLMSPALLAHQYQFASSVTCYYMWADWCPCRGRCTKWPNVCGCPFIINGSGLFGYILYITGTCVPWTTQPYMNILEEREALFYFNKHHYSKLEHRQTSVPDLTKVLVYEQKSPHLRSIIYRRRGSW